MILAKHETQKVHFKALSEAHRTSSIVGISRHYSALRFLMGHKKALQCAMLIQSNKFRKGEAEFIKAMPDSYMAFSLLSVTTQKRQLRLFNAIKRNNRIQALKKPSLRNQLRAAQDIELRKQNDEAPQGADSIARGVA
ncbi:hypothetical protein QWY97_10455 [Vibrio cortegadensis]|uniref:hypothetical protein n=1 Tax=Vibrio cortegadensis TaxID=1328770 RepID=UPI0021C3FB0C|nr:hypothetical protein [Vibrio cortegadensis]MDN3697766.1 hypothetical protein [Vibrio cortegadensis]